MASFMADRLSVQFYRQYVHLQWRLHAPLEPAIAPWLPPESAELRLRKCSWLLQDLQALGVRPAEPLIAPGPIATRAQAMGVLYVLEGSTLGLQAVRKQLQSQHPALQEAGRFMLGYGTETGRRWREFLAQLESVDEAEWPLAEAAASATFDYFFEAFSSVPGEAPST
jgi:heme oxygenase